MTKERAVNHMVESLTQAAKDQGVSLEGLTYENFNLFLDRAFKDGGETRCDRFADLAWPYAIMGTTFASNHFEEKQHECIKEAITRINQQT
jgi:hypothetical protein